MLTFSVKNAFYTLIFLDNTFGRFKKIYRIQSKIQKNHTTYCGCSCFAIDYMVRFFDFIIAAFLAALHLPDAL